MARLKQRQFDEIEIISALWARETGASLDDVCKAHAITPARFYTWRAKYRDRAGVLTAMARIRRGQTARRARLLARAERPVGS